MGFVDEKDSPLAKETEILFSCKGGAYLKLLVIMLAFMKEKGEFELYDLFYQQAESLGDALINVQKEADKKQKNLQKNMVRTVCTMLLVEEC